MTQSEIDDEKKRAKELAKSIGGSLAVILGLRRSPSPVEWDAKKARFRIDAASYISAKSHSRNFLM